MTLVAVFLAQPTQAQIVDVVNPTGAEAAYGCADCEAGSSDGTCGCSDCAGGGGGFTGLIGGVSSIGCRSCGNGCIGGACSSCDSCASCCLCGQGPVRDFLFCEHGYWGSLEYVMAFGKGRNVPPLATSGLPPAQGVLGPGTTIQFGGDIGSGLSHGYRVEFGTWLSADQSQGFGARIYGVDLETESYSANSPGFPLLANPFTNRQTLARDSRVIATPGAAAGNINIDNSAYALNVDAFLRSNVVTGCGYRMDLLLGYQYSAVEDQIVARSFSRDLNGVFLGQVGRTRAITDLFDTTNEFHGGSVGMLSQFHRNKMTLSLMGKVAYGTMEQRARIRGTEVVTDAGGAPTATFASGTYALGTNTGLFGRDVNVFSPEFNCNLGYQIHQDVQVTVGYSFLYWTRMLLAGDQIDPVINPSQFQDLPLLGAPRPRFNFSDTDYWIQGISFGVNWLF